MDLGTIFCKGESMKMLRVRYLVLQVVAFYNVIIKRNTLNWMRATISTAHLGVKYLLDNGKVGQIKVDQRRARKC